jgi:hypothetical protein
MVGALYPFSKVNPLLRDESRGHFEIIAGAKKNLKLIKLNKEIKGENQRGALTLTNTTQRD